MPSYSFDQGAETGLVRALGIAVFASLVSLFGFRRLQELETTQLRQEVAELRERLEARERAEDEKTE